MDHIYEELGVSPVLNALGHATKLGGATPSRTVQTLMDQSEEAYVDMAALADAVGERIADMLGADAAMVTSGAAAALALGAAACMTGDDFQKMDQIPDVTGIPHEFIIQKNLRIKYDRAVTVPGGKLVEVGETDETTPAHIEEAIGPNTAGIHYLAWEVPPGALPLEEVIRIGHAHNLPVIVDAAPAVYPTDNLRKFTEMGADLVAYGAKYFNAPNSTGLLVGRKDLVAIARTHSFIGFESTEVRSFARPMKLDRQEIVAVYASLREWLTMNHEDRFASYEARVAALSPQLSSISNIELADYPDMGPVEGLRIRINAQEVGKSAADVVQELRAGNPSIWVREDEDEDSFIIRMLTLKEGGETIIAERLKEIL